MNTDLMTARTGVGAGIGGVLGFVFAGPMGAAIGALVGGGVAHAKGPSEKGVMTARRKLIFSRAMESIKDPAELNKLADAFHGEGLPNEASQLRKRARLRELPQDAKEKRRAAFRKAMASDNPDLISKVGDAFSGEGAFDAAKALKDHADAVRAAHAAGKSARPLTGGSQAQFADKLAKAIIHFGSASAQARAAAGNLVAARGKTPSPELVAEVIRVAAEALKVEAPEAQGAPENPITIEEAPPAPEVDATPISEPSQVDAATVGSTAKEETAVGAPAGPIEAEVVSAGVAVESGAPAADHADAVASGEASEGAESIAEGVSEEAE